VTAPECQINDGMAEIVQKMHESNFIVFGVPNYFDNVSGIFKIFMDRFCPFCKLQLNGNQKFRGKHTIFVYVGAGGLHADAQNVLKNLHTATNGFVNYLGLNVVGEFAFVNSKTKNIVPSQKEIDNMIVNMTRLI
jgi:multimeric flavodoxin WrbA